MPYLTRPKKRKLKLVATVRGGGREKRTRGGARNETNNGKGGFNGDIEENDESSSTITSSEEENEQVSDSIPSLPPRLSSLSRGTLRSGRGRCPSLTTSPSRSHSCDVCRAKFRRREHLERHLLSHTQQRAFVCTECNQTFTRKDNMAVHMRKMHIDKPTK